MEEISQHLLYQRLCNRVIELFELYSAFEYVAQFGAFSAINLAHDTLPLDYSEAPNVFSEEEIITTNEFFRLINLAADATVLDTQQVRWLEETTEWQILRDFATKGLLVFSGRGRFSEEHELEL